MFVRLTYQIGQLFLLEMDSGPTVIDHVEVGRQIERSMEILKTNAELSPMLAADRSICILCGFYNLQTGVCVAVLRNLWT